MSRDLVREEDVLDLHARSDVVDDQRPSRGERRTFRDDTDVGKTRGKTPGHEVAGPVIRSPGAHRKSLPMPPEEDLEVRNPTVIDVRVRPPQAPDFRVARPVPLHVAMHERLQIGAEAPIRSNDDVGANAAVERNVAAGVIDPPIRRVVMPGHADLRESGASEAGAEFFCGDRRQKQRDQEGETHVRILNVAFSAAHHDWSRPPAPFGEEF